MRVHERGPFGGPLRRFMKPLERSGLTKELRKRKPYEARRRATLRKQSSIRKGQMQGRTGSAR
jgi:ribosomal protein S21